MISLRSSFAKAACGLGVALLTFSVFSPVTADTVTGLTASSRGLQRALATDDGMSFYNGAHRNGFNLSGGFFSGRASGMDGFTSSVGTQFRGAAELEGDQKMYALLLDGSYDFGRTLGSGFRPYLSGGLGMAMYGTGNAGVGGLPMQQGAMVPLFRFGGGVAYTVSEKWNLSLDYKAGFSSTLGDQFLSGRDQQQIGMHTVNMGMRYQF
ncbi:MAG: hypothetical protein SFW62_06430 [Alphaproteobacteria bacterium]|nr:hypothetical protein [Alphaproteobacteria bacterium]